MSNAIYCLKSDNRTYVNIMEEINNLIKKTMQQEKLKEVIDILTSSHNIILHGAPGTGKTYTARKIAEAMGCGKEHIGFVQFHPSYDYTDFVEGLRPTPPEENGNIGFQRVDGVFKAFCKKAVENLQRSNQTTASLLEKSYSIREIIEDFLEEAETDKKMFYTKQNEFYIESHSDEKIHIKIPSNERSNELRIRIDELHKLLSNDTQIQRGKDVTTFFNRRFRLQHDSYIYSLYQNLKPKVDNASLETVDLEERKNFVFIIDEINRGDISKIFGELFFSIDPGYRYKIDKADNAKTNTQYQNMILEEDDAFKDGFYIPENVYIIGTMNDIDRSVESMDFAMRRRFVFHEITAEMSAQSMGVEYLGSYLADLNDAIVKIDLLSKDYQIGASYVLGNKDCIIKDGDTDERKSARKKLWDSSIGCLLREYLRGSGREDKISDLAKAFGVE